MTSSESAINRKLPTIVHTISKFTQVSGYYVSAVACTQSSNTIELFILNMEIIQLNTTQCILNMEIIQLNTTQFGLQQNSKDVAAGQ